MTTMALSVEELRRLPAVIDIATAASVLGITRSMAYELVRTGDFPTRTLRLGRYVRVPTADLLELVGVERPAVLVPRRRRR